MTNEERLTLRARQILDDPTLRPNERLPHAGRLLAHLQTTMADDPSPVLDAISDPAVKDAMRTALTGIAADVTIEPAQTEDPAIRIDDPVMGCRVDGLKV